MQTNSHTMPHCLLFAQQQARDRTRTPHLAQHLSLTSHHTVPSLQSQLQRSRQIYEHNPSDGTTKHVERIDKSSNSILLVVEGCLRLTSTRYWTNVFRRILFLLSETDVRGFFTPQYILGATFRIHSTEAQTRAVSNGCHDRVF